MKGVIRSYQYFDLLDGLNDDIFVYSDAVIDVDAGSVKAGTKFGQIAVYLKEGKILLENFDDDGNITESHEFQMKISLVQGQPE